MAEPPAPPGLAGLLGWLPIPALVLAADGSAVAANPAWATLSPVAAGGEGWLDAVEPAFRPALGARLRLAAFAGEPGSTDCQAAGRGGGRWSRWWWQPIPPGGLVVCVAVMDDGQARAPLPAENDPRHPLAGPNAQGAPQAGMSTDVASAVTHHIFEAGVAMESAARLIQGPMGTLVLRVLDDLDQLVRDIRQAMFQARTRAVPPPDAELPPM
jgi:hypothetical protein